MAEILFTRELLCNALAAFPNESIIAESARVCTASKGQGLSILSHLVRQRHTKPLEYAHVLFEVQLPIFLDRQLQTHRLVEGSMAASGRYGAVTDTFYLPDEVNDVDLPMIEEHIIAAKGLMYGLSDDPMRNRELTRNLMPQCQMTTRRFMMNLTSFANFYRQRSSNKAQLEMQCLAEQMKRCYADHFPVLVSALELANWWS